MLGRGEGGSYVYFLCLGEVRVREGVSLFAAFERGEGGSLVSLLCLGRVEGEGGSVMHFCCVVER